MRPEFLRFDNSFARELPADPVEPVHVRKVRDAAYSHARPTPVASPRLFAWSREVAAMLDLGDGPLDAEARDRWAEVLSGNHVLDAMQPIATRYGGHQFGNWAGQLGDGRAISLGEVQTTRHGRLELQLKGAGPTPYSRRADGRAVLRSSLREFLCSEAMHHLGVPTTRALSLVTTGDAVERDMFYDGRAEFEPGAIVCRVAPTFLRFGHFEMPAADGELELLARLFSYAVRTHFPGFSADASDPEAVIAWFTEVAARTAAMIVEWQRVGFVHGVMNTDNMSVLGLTIDYGPYGFLEPYDPGWTPNTTDAHGRRYRYGNQPPIALWNLARFAESLIPLLSSLPDAEIQKRLVEVLDRTGTAMGDAMRSMYARKLGFVAAEDDDALLGRALAALQRTEADFTLFFRRLGAVAESNDPDPLGVLGDIFYSPSTAGREALIAVIGELRARWVVDGRTPVERRRAMDATNPAYVPRNWLAQEAIDAAAAGEPSKLEALLDLLRTPYTEREGIDPGLHKRPEWARQKAGCSMLSCSS